MADLCYMELNLMQIFDVLRNASLARLALCDGAKPYIVPMHYQLEVSRSDAVLHLASPAHGRKADALRRCASVCAEIELSGCGWLDTVLAEGTVRLTDTENGGLHLHLHAEHLSGRRIFDPCG